MTPEFSRTFPLARIGEIATAHHIEADEQERMALAKRFGLVAIDALDADASLRRDGEGIVADGTVRAAVTQSCVATGRPLAADISEAFTVRFVTALDESADEIELESDACDVMVHDGSAVDLGEATAQTLLLALDPYPRAADADARLREAGVIGEGETGPFAALKGLFGKP